MSKSEIRAEIEIGAPPQAVWDVLANHEHWSKWNPVLMALHVDGPLREGMPARLTVQLGPPMGPRTIPVRLVAAREPHELAWEGGPAGLIRARHGFVLEPTATGTRVVHTEVFEGTVASPLIWLLRSRLEKSYERFNRGLRDRCESA
ncbi:MAG: SRPBCC domain-containing protein [Nannocystaceae bacterium]